MGARLIVDASHSLGVVPVAGPLCDVIVSCAYKWLLGVHGAGVLFVNSKRWADLVPPWVGWHSVVPVNDWRHREGYQLKPGAERFEIGNPSFISLYILDNALQTLKRIGIEQIEAHVLALGGRLRRGLTALDLPLLTAGLSTRREYRVRSGSAARPRGTAAPGWGDYVGR